MDVSVLLGFLGGLGLFIYGMYLLSDSLKSLSSSFLKSALEKITSNRIKSVFTGVFITSIIQSSSATSVILISFLNAGMLTLLKAVPVIIGANIGTTITAQLIAFKLTKIAPLFIFFGSIIFFVSKKNKHKIKGRTLLGFGLLFLGLATMTAAAKPLSGSESITNLFFILSEHPLLAVLVGIVLTVLLQSSSTTIGIVIALASAGLLDLSSAIYLVLGDNIGTCSTAIIASVTSNLASKRLALGHTLFNVIGTIIMMPLIPLYIHFIPMLSADIARQIANTHTIFNVVNAIIFIPLIPLYVKLLEKIIPGKEYTKEGSKFLEPNLLNTPILAIGAVVKELGVMTSICQRMFNKAKKCVFSYDHKLRKEISIDEDSIDELQKNITFYLVEITKRRLSDKNATLIPALIHSINDVERAADYCENIAKSAEKIYEDDLKFSSYAKEELNKLFAMTDELMTLTKKAVEEDDHEAARKTLEIDLEINKLAQRYKTKHIKRLEKGICDGYAGFVYNNILIFIERINAHLCNITKGVLHIGKR